MTLRKALLAAAVVLSVPMMPALAHDDEDNGYDSHDRFHDQLSDAHERAHDRFHDQLSDAHERAHEYGFYSRGEHRAYHRALRDLHDAAHGYQPRYYYYSRPRYYGYSYGYGYRGY